MTKKAKKVEYNRIKGIMEKTDVKVVDLAARIRKSRVVVSNYVNNNTQPSLPTLKLIADALGVRVKDLIND